MQKDGDDDNNNNDHRSSTNEVSQDWSGFLASLLAMGAATLLLLNQSHGRPEIPCRCRMQQQRQPGSPALCHCHTQTGEQAAPAGGRSCTCDLASVEGAGAPRRTHLRSRLPRPVNRLEQPGIVLTAAAGTIAAASASTTRGTCKRVRAQNTLAASRPSTSATPSENPYVWALESRADTILHDEKPELKKPVDTSIKKRSPHMILVDSCCPHTPKSVPVLKTENNNNEVKSSKSSQEICADFSDVVLPESRLDIADLAVVDTPMTILPSSSLISSTANECEPDKSTATTSNLCADVSLQESNDNPIIMTITNEFAKNIAGGFHEGRCISFDDVISADGHCSIDTVECDVINDPLNFDLFFVSSQSVNITTPIETHEYFSQHEPGKALHNGESTKLEHQTSDPIDLRSNMDESLITEKFPTLSTYCGSFRQFNDIHNVDSKQTAPVDGKVTGSHYRSSSDIAINRFDVSGTVDVIQPDSSVIHIIRKADSKIPLAVNVETSEDNLLAQLNKSTDDLSRSSSCHIAELRNSRERVRGYIENFPKLTASGKINFAESLGMIDTENIIGTAESLQQLARDIITGKLKQSRNAIESDSLEEFSLSKAHLSLFDVFDNLKDHIGRMEEFESEDEDGSDQFQETISSDVAEASASSAQDLTGEDSELSETDSQGFFDTISEMSEHTLNNTTLLINLSGIPENCNQLVITTSNVQEDKSKFSLCSQCVSAPSVVVEIYHSQNAHNTSLTADEVPTCRGVSTEESEKHHSDTIHYEKVCSRVVKPLQAKLQFSYLLDAQPTDMVYFPNLGICVQTLARPSRGCAPRADWLALQYIIGPKKMGLDDGSGAIASECASCSVEQLAQKFKKSSQCIVFSAVDTPASLRVDCQPQCPRFVHFYDTNWRDDTGAPAVAPATSTSDANAVTATALPATRQPGNEDRGWSILPFKWLF